jgi:hypothetical protein
MGLTSLGRGPPCRYYLKDPWPQCPAGTVYPDRYSCFYGNWSNWAGGFWRADGAGPTNRWPIKQGTAQNVYTWWTTGYDQNNLLKFGGEPASGAQCVFALSTNMFSDYNGTTLADVYKVANWINYKNKTAPGALWGWADPYLNDCTDPCRVICRGTCTITGTCAAPGLCTVIDHGCKAELCCSRLESMARP